MCVFIAFLEGSQCFYSGNTRLYSGNTRGPQENACLIPHCDDVTSHGMEDSADVEW